MVSLQSIIWVFLLNNFSRVINLLLTKLARDRTGRRSALGLSCTDLAALGPYCQDLRPIFSQYGARAWLIRYVSRRTFRQSRSIRGHMSVWLTLLSAYNLQSLIPVFLPVFYSIGSFILQDVF